MRVCSFTDPSGFSRASSFNRFITFFAAAHGDFGHAYIDHRWGMRAYNDPYVRTVAGAVAAYYTAGAFSGWAATAGYGATASGAIGGAAGGFAAGGIQGGNLNSALSGALSGALFGAAGKAFDAGTFESYAAHAVAGCASSSATGGNCSAGAAGALTGKLVTNATVELLGKSPAAHFAAAVIGGGAGSKAAGGSFENGAFSAALGFALNQMQSCPYGHCKQAYAKMWNDLVKAITGNPVSQQLGEGIQGEVNTNAMVAVGVGVSTSTALVTDFNYSSGASNTCMVSTVCGILGPIAGSTVGAGGAFSTGTLTRGEEVYQIGLITTASAGPGIRWDPAIASNGSLTIGTSGTFGLAFGAGISVCKQVTSKTC
jgi:hypothetical protein